MKKYNKPVVEINGFEVEDIITISGSTAAQAATTETTGVYNSFVGATGSEVAESNVLIYEW